MNLHLRCTKRYDEIGSFHSSEGLRSTESKSMISNSGRLTSKKAEFDCGKKSRFKKNYGLAEEMKRQGMLEDYNDGEKWISTSNDTGKFVYTHIALILWVP
jgi:hypothetical protein